MKHFKRFKPISVDSFDYTGGGIWVLTGYASDGTTKAFFCAEAEEWHTLGEINFFSEYPFDDEDGTDFLPKDNFDSLLFEVYDKSPFGEDWFRFWSDVFAYVKTNSTDEKLEEAAAWLSSFEGLLWSYVSGPWSAEVIHLNNADYPNYPYRITMNFETGASIATYGVDWKSLCTEVRMLTGIRLTKRSSVKFRKLSDCEQFARI